MYNHNILVEAINCYEQEKKWFWIAGCAKEWYPVLKNHLDELLPLAREAVEHYMDMKGK
jgi:hypothetical protein